MRRGALWCVLRPCGSIARQQLELVAVRACVQWSQYSAHARVEQRSRLARSMASAVVSFRKVHPWGIGRPGAPVAWVGRLCPRTRGQIALHFCALRDTPNIRTQHTAPQFVLLICVRYSSPLASPSQQAQQPRMPSLRRHRTVRGVRGRGRCRARASHPPPSLRLSPLCLQTVQALSFHS